MRAADAQGEATPSQPAAIASVTGAGMLRRTVAELLSSAGFTVQDDDCSDSPSLLLALLSRASDAERVSEVRRLADTHEHAYVLAVMPAGAPNASLRRVLIAGASGIVLDDELERTLVPTARAMLAGQLTVPAALGRQIAPRPLSHREKQILALVMKGCTNREIAVRLFLAESTVKTHLSSAFRKLDARSRSEAVTRITDPESGYGRAVMEIANESLAATN